MAKKILVIDDEELVTESLKKLLSKSGYEVQIARSGTEAVERVKATDFDLIVSDIRMPDMDGVQALTKIREYLKEEGKPAMPEILITGYASKENLEGAKNLGVADYLYKPFNIRDFLEIVKKNLENK